MAIIYQKHFVIIVHYGSLSVTKRLISQVINPKNHCEKVIIIDHGPQKFPNSVDKKVLVIHPEKNGGYAAGINLGLGVIASQGALSHDLVTLLNNDLQIESDILNKINNWWRRQLENNPHIHILAGANSGHVNFLTGRASLKPWAKGGRAGVYLDGALLTAPYSTFLKLKGLPEEYFLYWEDVALSFRARAAGIKLAIIPNLNVKNPGSQKPATGDKLYYLVRNGAYFLASQTPPPVRLYWFILNRLRLLFHADQTIRQALKDAINNKMGARS